MKLGEKGGQRDHEQGAAALSRQRAEPPNQLGVDAPPDGPAAERLERGPRPGARQLDQGRVGSEPERPAFDLLPERGTPAAGALPASVVLKLDHRLGQGRRAALGAG